MKINPKKHLVGIWRIIHMDDFDKRDIDMEVPAYMKVEDGGSGEFQFILVFGNTCGVFKMAEKGAIFDFTWEGNDECDEASGDGWINTEDGKEGAGEIRIHNGDKYGFLVRKVKR